MLPAPQDGRTGNFLPPGCAAWPGSSAHRLVRTGATAVRDAVVPSRETQGGGARGKHAYCVSRQLALAGACVPRAPGRLLTGTKRGFDPGPYPLPRFPTGSRKGRARRGIWIPPRIPARRADGLQTHQDAPVSKHRSQPRRPSPGNLAAGGLQKPSHAGREGEIGTRAYPVESEQGESAPPPPGFAGVVERMRSTPERSSGSIRRLLFGRFCLHRSQTGRRRSQALPARQRRHCRSKSRA